VPPRAEFEERCHVVHRILAGARPTRGDTDDPTNWPQYTQIWPHLEPSQAAECSEDPVRTLSLRLNGESLEARELDADTLDRRRQVLGSKHPYTLQSVLALARDHRELGDFQQSLSML